MAAPPGTMNENNSTEPRPQRQKKFRPLKYPIMEFHVNGITPSIKLVPDLISNRPAAAIGGGFWGI